MHYGKRRMSGFCHSYIPRLNEILHTPLTDFIETNMFSELQIIMKCSFYGRQDVLFLSYQLWNLFFSTRWQVSDEAIKQCDIWKTQTSLKLTSDFPRLKQAPLVNSSQCHSASCGARKKQHKASNKPSRRSKHQKHLALCHHEPLWKALREPKQNNVWLSTVAKKSTFLKSIWCLVSLCEIAGAIKMPRKTWNTVTNHTMIS